MHTPRDRRAAPLPNWYPLANATDSEIDSWLAADEPPLEEMRAALPWLTEPYQLRAWVEGLRLARSEVERGIRIVEVLPGVTAIPLPPRRLEGRKN